MGIKQHISRTWQMIEQQVNDVPFRPDNENNSRLNRCVTTVCTEKAGHFTTVLRQMKMRMI